jgi:ketosteroid isomerase-like protein
MIADEITRMEDELRAAQLHADVAALDRLISEDLLFTGPDGALASKADDLAAYRDGVMRVTAHEIESLNVRPISRDVAAVAVRVHMTGSYAGTPFSGLVRYTRVWAREVGPWQIVAGHVSVGAPSLDSSPSGT